MRLKWRSSEGGGHFALVVNVERVGDVMGGRCGRRGRRGGAGVEILVRVVGVVGGVPADQVELLRDVLSVVVAGIETLVRGDGVVPVGDVERVGAARTSRSSDLRRRRRRRGPGGASRAATAGYTS